VWQLAAGVIPAPLVAGLVLVGAAAFAAIVLLTRHVVHRLDRWAAVFAFPILCTAWEHLVSVAGTSASIAYSQIDFPPAVQIASVTGLWGVTFLVALPPAALAVAWRLRRRPEQSVWALAVPFGLCAAALRAMAAAIVIAVGVDVIRLRRRADA
jgi:apolipoprotein N-acyltransferase